MKLFLTLYVIFLSLTLCGQRKYFTVGTGQDGICIGNAQLYNGLRLNLSDRKVDRINGLNLSGNASAKHLNGISAGVIVCRNSISNGLTIGGLSVMTGKHNGLAIAGLHLEVAWFNGLGISGWNILGDSLKQDTTGDSHYCISYKISRIP